MQRLTPAQQELVLQFRALACKLARKWANRSGGDVEEYECEAFRSLCKAAMAFEPERGIKFITYAWRAIEQNLWRYMRGPVHQLPMEPQEAEDGRWDFPANDRGPDEHVEAEELLEVFRRTLRAREYTIMHLHCFDGLSWSDIAKLQKCSRERIRQIRTQACKRLAEAIQ